MPHIRLTQERVRELFSYDPERGELRWRTGRRRGKIAGTPQKYGHRLVTIGHADSFFAHYIIWIYVYGVEPIGEIGHKDHNGGNNRISNLHDVPHGENMKNLELYNNNISGVVGVHKHGNSWMAQITVEGKKKYLGCFQNFHLAVAARKSAERLYGFHENHGTSLRCQI